MKNRVLWLVAVLLIGCMASGQGYAQEVVNLLANGGFETGVIAPYGTYGAGTNEVVTNCVGAVVPEGPIEGNYCLHIVIPAAGANNWDSGMTDGSHTFVAGKKYTFSAFLKCKSGTLQFRMKPERGQDPWEGYGDQVFTMTDTWQEFSVTTPVFAANVTPASPTFHFAFAAGDFWIDNVRLYEGDYVAPGNVKAHDPVPEDGAAYPNTWANLTWTPGKFAVSHDVYFGDSYDAVSAGDPGVFQGNQASNYLVVGFPGFPYPDGLVPGTTYYWRVDEVNDLHPESPWVGNVWRFMVPPKKAFNPSPADGSKFIAPDVKLTWQGGFGAILHHVYFGDNFADVDAGTGGTSKGPTGVKTYTPAGPLTAGKTYYWRIDEFDGSATNKGDVWVFTIAGTGGGIRGDYYKGMNFETLALSRTDPQINFNWGNNGPDPAVGNDNFSVRWTGEVEAVFTEKYTFYPRSDDGVRLWVDGELLVDSWIDRGPTEDQASIELVGGSTYSLVMEYYENGGGAVAELRWSSPRTPKAIIPQAALSLPVKASSPSPRSGSVDVIQHPILKWNAGQSAASHDVYFGMDQDAVRNATKSSPEYKGSKALGSESYDPGKLAWGVTYYWRVDEINTQNAASPWIGNVWSFTTADFLKIDDFESYTDNDAANEAIWQSWIDGFGVATNGSQVGYVLPPYAEQTIVHAGNQSMPLLYNNTAGVLISEATLTLKDARNWTEEGVDTLSIWFRGMPGSVGSFVESPAGTFTMTASGTDIWDVGTAGDYRDEFHFAYKTLTGAGTIVAKVVSIQNTDQWAKAGVMIRDTLEPGSKHAFACITPGNGVASQGRIDTGGASFNTAQGGITAPHWVKLERSMSGSFIVSHSANGTTWTPVTGSNPTNIQMGSTVYVGLALTAHNAGATCRAVFSNVTITGTAGAQWSHQDIGIESNAAEPLYVAVANAAGNPAVVYNDNPNAAQLDVWTRWNIPLQQFADKGINLTNVDKLTIGLGNKGNVTAAGGSGVMYFDDIRLTLPAPIDTSNKLVNGGFEDGVIDPWNIYGNATGEVVTELVDAVVPEAPIEGTYCLYVLVPEAAANFWEVGLQPVGEVFEKGKQYTISAFLKAKSGTMDINFKPELGASPWTGYGEKMMTITDQWAEYSVTTPVFDADVDPASFTFHIGSAVGGFWVDNVRFYEGGYVAP